MMADHLPLQFSGTTDFFVRITPIGLLFHHPGDTSCWMGSGYFLDGRGNLWIRLVHPRITVTGHCSYCEEEL